VAETIRLAVRAATVFGTAAHLVAALILTWSLVMTYRWISRRSVLLAWLFAAGIIVRAAGGVALFLTSFFGWPWFRSLQMGAGFWTLALDGRMYYDIASNATLHGLSSILDSHPSALYLRVLALWMSIFGVAPASALLLNVAAYAASVGLIVLTAGIHDHAKSRDIPGAVITLTVLTFSPALLVFSTQPLKDPLCLLFLISAMCGARLLWAPPSGAHRRRSAHIATGMGLMAIGMYGLGGIRAYVCIFVIAAVAATAAYNALIAVSAKRRLQDAVRDGALIVLLWIAFVMGAGPYAWPYESAILAMIGAPATPINVLDAARAGFTASGGATAVAHPEERVGDGTDFVRSAAGGRIGWLIRGLAVFFVPITALAAAKIVTFSGGQGLLAVTDFDTVAIDLTVAVSLGVVLLSLKRHRLSCPMIFALVLGFLLIASMAYVVTNYGTLFRLRIMAVMPLWMMPVMFEWRRHNSPAGFHEG
jgi:hypothetical protein